MPIRYGSGNITNMYDGFHYGYCYVSSLACNTNKAYIHEYSYKPKPLFHKTLQDKEPILFLGCEIEVDKGGQSEENAEIILDKYGENEQALYIKRDGSLSSGFEIVTHPMTLNYHKNFQYKQMFDDLNEMGYRSHDTTTCGLHVHVNRNYFGTTQKEQTLGILKLVCLFEKFEKEICILSRRRKSRYAVFAKDNWTNDADDPIMLFAHSVTSPSRHWAINLHPKETIEIRCFKGTLNINTFYNTLEFISIITDISKSESVENIYNIKWKDIEKRFSVSLLEYYQKRVEIEKIGKNVKMDLENGNSISILNTQESIRGQRAAMLGTSECLNTLEEAYGSLARSCNTIESFSIEYMNVFQQPLSHEQKIKTLKKKIKDAQRKIRNADNYFEQRRLQQDIDMMKRDLKLLKRNTNYHSSFLEE